MFFNKENANSTISVYPYHNTEMINMIDGDHSVLKTLDVPQGSRVYLLSANDLESYPTQRWEIGTPSFSNPYTVNILAIVSSDDNGEYITYYLGDQMMADRYQVQESVDETNIQDILDGVYTMTSLGESDEDKDTVQEEHICNIDYDLISSNFKDLINSEILNLQSIIEDNKKSINEALKNLQLQENININTQVDSTGLNTVLANIDTALINLENSLSSINSAIKEVDRVVDKDSANKTDNIQLAVSKLESAAKILNDQIDASVDLNSKIRLNIDDIALAQNKLITSLNQHLIDSTTASSNLMAGIKTEVGLLKQQIVESNLIVQNLIQKVEQNDSNVINSVSTLQNHVSEISKRIDNYDLNICSANMTKKKFFEDMIEFLKRSGLALIVSFWAVVVILLIKEVLL